MKEAASIDETTSFYCLALLPLRKSFLSSPFRAGAAGAVYSTIIFRVSVVSEVTIFKKYTPLVSDCTLINVLFTPAASDTELVINVFPETSVTKI